MIMGEHRPHGMEWSRERGRRLASDPGQAHGCGQVHRSARRTLMRPVRRRFIRPTLIALGMLLSAWQAHPVLAEVSARDGYGPGGAYQFHVELVPYVWLPAVSGNVTLGR